MELSISEPIACARCEIELGEGRGRCRRAKGTDICLDCAIEMYPPIEEDESRGGPIEESPSYRDAMNDAGRARQLR